EWDFGAGSLLVGKNYTPLLFPYSNQVYSIHSLGKGDHNMSTFGMLYGQRKAMIRLKFGGFQIAAVDCKTLVNLSPALSAGGISQPDKEESFPSIQAKYKYDFEKGHIAAAGAYYTFDVLSGGNDYAVDSWIAALGGQLNVGPAYFKANIWGGQNVGHQADILVNGGLWSSSANAGSGNFDGDGFGLARWDGTKIIDRDALAYMVVAGYEIRKGLYLEAGYGYTRTELDEPNSTKDDAETVYLQSTIFLAPGVFITPEIGYCDMKQTDQPEIFYYGMKWQINF
ncbi:MAG: porin, partial [Desulfobacterales bacterium]|nr:porin [Desulfobacterales bacterium]